MVSPEQSASQEPRRAVALVGTFLPHLAAERHHVYRFATAVALLGSLLAAAYGSLSVALVLAAVALPAVVLVYIHDHRLWRDEPITVIALTFGLSLVLGVGVGLVHTYFTPGISVAAGGYQLPPVERIVELGVLVPVVAFVAVMAASLLVTARAAFGHPLDVVVTCVLSGAALSLGLSVVVQHGAFTHLQASAGEPTRVAFIALTLGFLQPVILASAAAVAVLGLRNAAVNPAAGILKGLLVPVVYGLAVTLLASYGSRGIVLTALAAFVLAGVGLVTARAALHSAVDAAPDVERVEHRLHGAVVAAIIAVVITLAAGITAAVTLRGPTNPPKPPNPSGIVPTTHTAAAIHPGTPAGRGFGNLVLASTTTSLAAGIAVNFLDGVSATLAPGWYITTAWDSGVWAHKSDNTAAIEILSGHAAAPGINADMARLIKSDIINNGYTNVVQSPSGDGVQTVRGKNFTQDLVTGYTADQQGNQGTIQLCGFWTELFNPATQLDVFISLRSADLGKLQAATPDARSMVASVL